MDQFVAGDIVVVNFPFSNLSGQKRRPALVLAVGEFKNLILCQITSKSYSSQLAIRIKPADFAEGGLPVTSYIRPDKLFTCDPAIINKKAGQLTVTTRTKILKKVRELFR